MTDSEYRQLVEFLGQRFDAIDRRLDGHDRRFVAIDQRFADMDRRFDELREHIDGRFREVFGHLDHICGRLERLEQEYHAILQALRRIESLLVDEQKRREILERSLAELKEHVALLQARIETIERQLRG